MKLRIQLIIITLLAGSIALNLLLINELSTPRELSTDNAEIALSDLASNKLYDIITNRHFDHTDYNGCNFSCRVARSGVLGINGIIHVSENLYVYPSCDIRNAIDKWTESPTHLANLDRPYDYGVILIYRMNDNRCYIIYDVAG